MSAYCVPDIGNIIMIKTDSWIFYSSANASTKPTDFYKRPPNFCGGCTGASIGKLLELPESPGASSS